MKNPGNIQICIIDGSRTYRKIIETSLSALNFTNLISFENAEKCLLSNVTPDIIVLEYEFGQDKLNGYDFFRLYHKRFEKTEFIFLSSNTNMEVAVNTIKIGANDYIVKSKEGITRLISRIHKIVKDSNDRYLHRLTSLVLLSSIGFLCIIFIAAIIVY